MLVLAALVYGAFFVPIGQHTLYRHAVRIGGTPEAAELWSALAEAGALAKQKLLDALSGRAAAQPEDARQEDTRQEDARPEQARAAR